MSSDRFGWGRADSEQHHQRDRPRRYVSPDEDSARWSRFEHRPGDIVISTRSKSGTTWMQMICALLVFRTGELPRPLAEISPWLDWLVVPEDEVFATLAAQQHRRFIKTHTPLDGLPLRPDVTYIVVARHPLDMAVSLYHQGANLDRARLAELTAPVRMGPDRIRAADSDDHAEARRPPLSVWLRTWIDDDADPVAHLDSLPGVLRHLDDAWRRADEPNVVLAHYADLSTDLPGEMRRLADVLDIDTDDDEIDRLAPSAGFAAMRARSDELAPDPAGVLRERHRFFRRGRSGAAAEVLDDADLDHYAMRTASMAHADLLTWLHRT